MSGASFITRDGIVYPGDILGQDRRFISGINTTVTSEESDIWTPDIVKVYPDIAAPIGVVSDDAEDAMAGDGTNVLFIEGLDEDFNLVNELINLDGLSTVFATKSYLRILKAVSATVGGNGENVGVISLDIGGALQARIENTVGLTINTNLGAHFTVPKGKRAYVLKCMVIVSSSVGGDPASLVTVVSRTPPGPFVTKAVTAMNVGNFVYELVVPEPLEEFTDFVVRANKITPGNFSIVSALTEILLVDNDFPKL